MLPQYHLGYQRMMVDIVIMQHKNLAIRIDAEGA
jgi:hypothetical protein